MALRLYRTWAVRLSTRCQHVRNRNLNRKHSLTIQEKALFLSGGPYLMLVYPYQYNPHGKIITTLASESDFIYRRKLWPAADLRYDQHTGCFQSNSWKVLLWNFTVYRR